MQSKDLFIPMLTDNGVCYALNALNSNEIYTDEYVQCVVVFRTIERYLRLIDLQFTEWHLS